VYQFDAAQTALTAAPAPRLALSQRALIRMLDIFLAVSLLVAFAPLMLLIALTIQLQDGGAALFAQERVGRGGRVFRCLKFRSMVLDAEDRLQALLRYDAAARQEWARDQKLRDDPRITPLGRFLRISSLDELPQLWNVLRGDMSLVGPRPIVPGEIVRYGRCFGWYCSVKPGLTGLWQVSGRNGVSYRRRVALDVVYARRRSLALYCVILVRTVPAVLLRDGSC
jgi:exopolysaccharide production protein ExoY